MSSKKLGEYLRSEVEALFSGAVDGRVLTYADHQMLAYETVAEAIERYPRVSARVLARELRQVRQHLGRRLDGFARTRNLDN